MTPEMMAALRKPFPPEALETKEVSGKKFTYIAHHAVNRRLLDVTNGNMSFAIMSEQQIPWGKTAKGQETILHKVVGRLTLGFTDTDGTWRTVSSDGTGVQIVYVGTGEDMLKGGESDALKKAASKLGVGLDLYGTDMEAEVALTNLAQDKNQGELASVDQRVMIQALWKKGGKVVRDKKGHEHHDAIMLDQFLRHQYGASILTLGKENATTVIDQFTARLNTSATAQV